MYNPLQMIQGNPLAALGLMLQLSDTSIQIIQTRINATQKNVLNTYTSFIRCKFSVNFYKSYHDQNGYSKYDIAFAIMSIIPHAVCGSYVGCSIDDIFEQNAMAYAVMVTTLLADAHRYYNIGPSLSIAIKYLGYFLIVDSVHIIGKDFLNLIGDNQFSTKSSISSSANAIVIYSSLMLSTMLVMPTWFNCALSVGLALYDYNYRNDIINEKHAQQEGQMSGVMKHPTHDEF